MMLTRNRYRRDHRITLPSSRSPLCVHHRLNTREHASAPALSPTAWAHSISRQARRFPAGNMRDKASP
jgi:hypothetical protein